MLNFKQFDSFHSLTASAESSKIMITVPEATKKIIERSRYLSEAISKGIINYSALARYIRPEIEQILIKKVSLASVIMALNRISSDFQPKFVSSNIFKIVPELSVRSGFRYVALSSDSAAGLSLLLSRETDPKSLFFKSQGRRETTFILSQDLFDKYKNAIEGKNPIIIVPKVSALTIYLPQEAIKTPGIYYFFLKSLAWEGINVLELISTPGELILIIEDTTTERTFGIIKSLFAS